jgi:hypothetical protein
VDKIMELFRYCGGRPAVIQIKRSNSQGWHVRISTRATWARSAVAVVAAQSILGSDSKREMFNLMRALRLPSRARFWRERGHRWNPTYRRKL